ncbi:tRNA pseudouridine(38-40) synthase TruA [Winogradskyella sp. SYSU M77433]|uniref:tRNA pseudouridine(38-40) synthase TruA n=1 Tax=Winogradskyella sp. SYSU M77433 TaxID=3042722 RepID=UPI0024800DAE|nr:tRNA pseudouridine(38-40) synthase TruA [Winogradskyella sp. SYSU M77433]MDH7911298.1 tRNA pseudouridine(38-40) synthase TruA [Winogradskyella sp. SYSU M77433]
MRYFIELSYNGKAYHGWQNQPNAITVQEVLEKALSTILKSEISIVGAGRTDAGVHASQMFAHFDYDENFEAKDLVYKLNSFLPKDVAIQQIFKVKPEAHARFDAVSRTYHYKVSTSKNVFDYDFAYEVQLPLNVDAMNKACKILFEYRDFQCFSKSNTDVKTYNCDIKEAYWTSNNNQLIFTITADRFLRNMVRAIVGTMVNIGLGKLKPEDLHAIIKSKDRGEAGFSVPAHGLYLTEIVYPEDIRN